jgi:hypothetical protein
MEALRLPDMQTNQLSDVLDVGFGQNPRFVYLDRPCADAQLLCNFAVMLASDYQFHDLPLAGREAANPFLMVVDEPQPFLV